MNTNQSISYTVFEVRLCLIRHHKSMYFFFLSLLYRGIRCTNVGLNVVDSIVPELINVMDKYFELMD